MAEPRDDAQERTEEATPRRRQQAKERGQVPRSRELSTTALLLVGAGALTLVGPRMAMSLTEVMRACFGFEARALGDELYLARALAWAMLTSLEAMAAFLGLVAAAAVLAPLAIGGWSFSAEAVSLNWDKLDPVQGLRRMFSAQALMELAKALAKFLVVGGASLGVLWLTLERFLAAGAEPVEQASAHAAHLVVLCLVLLSASTLLVAAVDVPFQLWNHARKLRMSRQQVKDELKETEGRPEVRMRIRALQREVAERRMMEEVPKADVVVTNPTHFAVALRYDAERMDAPRLVAKGADLVAFNIRRVAEAHRVPIVSAPALARSIYFNTKLGREIPVGLYLAVAQVLAYVFRLRERSPAQPAPELPDELPIPAELKR